MRRAEALLASAVLALAACDDPPAGALTRCDATFVLPAAVQTDILFVIDDSGSMAGEQANVSANLDAFVQALDASPVANDYQIGVTNTSVEDFTAGDVTYAAGPNGPGAFPPDGLEYPAGRLVAVNPATGVYSYTTGSRILDPDSPTFLQDFQANVLVGTSGTGKEQPFRAARLALGAAAPGGANVGFLRPGARLAIVFLSDEDDCSDESGDVTAASGCLAKGSLDPVSDLVAYLRGPIAGETRDVVVAAIVGLDLVTLEPSCGDSGNPGCDPPTPNPCTTAYDKGDRFVALLNALGSAATVRDSICDASFADSLQAIAGLIVPDTMPLEGAPADWRMLAVTVTKEAGATVACEVAPDGPSPPLTADAIYTPPQAGGSATLTFRGDCTLAQGDRVDVRIVCAG